MKYFVGGQVTLSEGYSSQRWGRHGERSVRLAWQSGSRVVTLPTHTRSLEEREQEVGPQAHAERLTFSSKVPSPKVP